MHESVGDQKRVQFDFDIEFANGGGLQGQGFRLDIPHDDIDDLTLSEAIVRELRLLMVGRVRIFNKTVISEPHKQQHEGEAPATREAAKRIDLSHTIEDGMITYKGLPAPLICDHLSRVQSRSLYAEGTEFQIGRITMVSNTGTYIDSPFHRYAQGTDIAQLELQRLAELDAVVVRTRGMAGRAITREMLLPYDVEGKAVLIETGWDTHWRTDQYFEGHPFLTADAALHLERSRPLLVGIDSYNIDDTADMRRPVHTVLLGAGIPIVEHLRGLAQLPIAGFQFSAVPPKVAGMGTFPVRAYATVPE